MGDYNKLMEKLLEWLNRSDAFLSAQVPDMIQQLLRWQLIKASIGGVFGLLIIIVVLYAWRKGLLELVKKDSEPFFLIVFGGIVPVIAGTIVLAVNSLTVLQILIAPKVYLIEYVHNLMLK